MIDTGTGDREKLRELHADLTCSGYPSCDCHLFEACGGKLLGYLKARDAATAKRVRDECAKIAGSCSLEGWYNVPEAVQMKTADTIAAKIRGQRVKDGWDTWKEGGGP